MQNNTRKNEEALSMLQQEEHGCWGQTFWVSTLLNMLLWKLNLLLDSFFFFFLSFFTVTPAAHASSQTRGSNWSCSCRPTPQTKQHWIWVTSATYITAYSNAGSLTGRARPGIKPTSSRTLCWVLNLLSHNGNSSLASFTVSRAPAKAPRVDTKSLLLRTRALLLAGEVSLLVREALSY